MTNFSTGHHAETVAAEYLSNLGYKVLALNWRTKYCEIDIIAQKDKRVYFVEVKYRRTTSQGSGLDYVTTKKLSQMRFAAELWMQENRWKHPSSLSALEITGPNFAVTNFVSDWM